nr:structural protein [Riboviria sp.]
MATRRMSRARASRNVSSVQQISSIVNRMINSRAEHKVLSKTNLANTTATAGTVINLSNDIIQGDNFDNRSGDTIRVLKTKFKIQFQGVTTDSVNRYIVFRDMQNLGTTPAVTDVLNSASFISGYDGLNVYQQKRFVILKDYSMTNNINGQTLLYDEYTNNTPYKIYYNGATAVASANGKGALFVLVIGSGSTATFNLDVELVYTDS